MAQQKNVLKHAALVLLGDKIRSVCKPDPRTEGYCAYIEGWSDQRIVDEAEGALTIHNVIGLRSQLLGSLIAPKSMDPTEILHQQIISLIRKKTESLDECVLKLMDQQDQLIAWAKERPIDPFRIIK